MKVIKLYDETRSDIFDIDIIGKYLKTKFPEVKILNEKCFYLLKDEEIETIALKRAKIRVLDPVNRILNPEPTKTEVDFEKRRLSSKNVKSSGLFYDAIKLVSICQEMISDDEKRIDWCHIVFTNELFGTFDENDRRWHARVSLFGFPSLISTTGLVEAPAKPKEFYVKKRLGANPYLLKEEFKGRFIDYEDERMNDVLCGYAVQAIFYHLSGEPFCDDRGCRLFNAHWQEDVIFSQIESDYEFCEKHRKKIEEFSKGEDYI
ncbi:MAG: hypothetical protein E3J87_11350 [Candidatus Cloacimonadota bacterium]|nr:MAG: hypothetical protein E3J87_11350 [Candidatus Cloacimonadota bacterium]